MPHTRIIRPVVLDRRPFDRLPLGLHLAGDATFVVALLLVLAFPTALVSDARLIAASIATLVVATVVSFLMGPRDDSDPRWLAAPLLTLLAAGLFRAGTGGGDSIFTALVVLPTLVIAAKDGRRYIAVAVLAAVGAISLSLEPQARIPSGQPDSLQSFITPLILTAVAVIVNAVGRQVRLQLASISAYAEERVVLLDEAEARSEELRRIADRMLAADQFTRGVLDAVTEQSVIGTDLHGFIDVWNPGAERLLHLSPHETQGHRFVHEFHVPDELERHASEIGLDDGYAGLVHAARQGDADVRDWTYRRDDGSIVPVRVAVTPRLDRQGETIGFIFVATDITELLAAARVKDEFVSLVSHELRTPLSSILGYLELLRDGETDAPPGAGSDGHPALSAEQLGYITVIERNAHRLLQLVGDLLLTAQAEAGQLSYTMIETDLAAVVRASVESASPAAVRAGVELRSHLPPAPVPVSADPVRLGQACDNLVSNALKFTPIGNQVTVSVRAGEGTAVIEVADTGMGIPAEEVGQLFVRFFRSSVSVRNAVPGIGLGLAITKAIVEAQGGSIEVESEEGVGTVFRVTLPTVAVPTGSGVGVPVPS